MHSLSVGPAQVRQVEWQPEQTGLFQYVPSGHWQTVPLLVSGELQEEQLVGVPTQVLQLASQYWHFPAESANPPSGQLQRVPDRTAGRPQLRQPASVPPLQV